MRTTIGWILSGLFMLCMLPSASLSDTTLKDKTTGSAASAKDRLVAPADVAKAPKDAIRTASGLAYKVIHPGDGTVHPKRNNRVTVNYTGWQTDGRMFDSSYKRGKPATFPLNRVIKGWTEGVQLMVVGETARFWIPAELAYGATPRGGRPGGELVFDIELLKIN